MLAALLKNQSAGPGDSIPLSLVTKGDSANEVLESV